MEPVWNYGKPGCRIEILQHCSSANSKPTYVAHIIDSAALIQRRMVETHTIEGKKVDDSKTKLPNPINAEAIVVGCRCLL